MRVFERAVVSEEGVSAETAILEVYGMYLMNGGTREGFLELTDDEIQMMYTSYFGNQRAIVLALGKMMGKLFSGGEDARP